MAEGDDDADVVGHVERGAQHLADHRTRAEIAETAARCGLQHERDRHEEAHEGNNLFGREAVLADPLDATVAEHPTGEAEDGNEDGGQVGDAGFHWGPSRGAGQVGEMIQSDMT